MNKLTKAAGAVIAASALAVTLAGPASASAPVNWTQRTCAAFAAWERHGTTGSLETVAADSFHVSWRGTGSRYGLGSDVWGLVADVRSGAAAKYVTEDERYISKDCQP
jgi:hypothetical protein